MGAWYSIPPLTQDYELNFTSPLSYPTPILQGQVRQGERGHGSWLTEKKNSGAISMCVWIAQVFQSYASLQNTRLEDMGLRVLSTPDPVKPPKLGSSEHLVVCDHPSTHQSTDRLSQRVASHQVYPTRIPRQIRRPMCTPSSPPTCRSDGGGTPLAFSRSSASLRFHSHVLMCW